MAVYFGLYIVEANELCPTDVPPVSGENCSINCVNDDQCANDEICCGNGCGQACMMTRCQVSPKQIISYCMQLCRAI